MAEQQKEEEEQAAASSRVVKIDGDPAKPARTNVNRRRVINEPRVRVIHPLLLEEPTSFAPCGRFVLYRHRCCRQASSFPLLYAVELVLLGARSSWRNSSSSPRATNDAGGASVAPHQLYTGGVGCLNEKKIAAGFRYVTARYDLDQKTRRDKQIPSHVKRA